MAIIDDEKSPPPSLRGGEADEALQSLLCSPWIASLAMTMISSRMMRRAANETSPSTQADAALPAAISQLGLDAQVPEVIQEPLSPRRSNDSATATIIDDEKSPPPSLRGGEADEAIQFLLCGLWIASRSLCSNSAKR